MRKEDIIIVSIISILIIKFFFESTREITGILPFSWSAHKTKKNVWDDCCIISRNSFLWHEYYHSIEVISSLPLLIPRSCHLHKLFVFLSMHDIRCIICAQATYQLTLVKVFVCGTTNKSFSGMMMNVPHATKQSYLHLWTLGHNQPKENGLKPNLFL